MTTSDTDYSRVPAPTARAPGVRARLLLAFLGIAAFAVLAAAAGIYAFREVGDRLQAIDTRVPPTVSALELSRSAERIIAAAPALLAATERSRRDEVKAGLSAEVEYLNGKLLELKDEQARALPLPLETIEPVVSALTASLGELDDLVERRLETSERIRVLRRDVFQANAEMQRLLAPWLEVVDYEISVLVEGNRQAAPGERGDDSGRLVSLIRLQRLLQTARRQVSAAVDMLAEASLTEQPQRLPIVDFQLGLALDELVEISAGLDPRLRPLFLERVAGLRQFVEGPNAIADARRRELALVGEGEERLAETADLSAQLTAAVDELGNVAKHDIDAAIHDALSVQRLSSRALVALVALSLLTSVLIVWLYVGGNIVRRLSALSDGMLAIAGGRLRTPVTVQGSDEIAAMARAVEIFRRNAIDLERLLEERKATAARLERQVEERTRELSEKSKQLEVANRYKSHFLSSASHDLRQPLHALNLFVAQLHSGPDAAERSRLVNRIDAAVSSMNELFEVLLDMSRLEAGILQPQFAEFPVERVLEHIRTNFADAARDKGVSLSVIPSGAWVRSDPVLLERILMNLVSNALRCTTRGGVVVGCRRRGGRMRIDVCDSGPGIAPEQRRKIFGEYYRVDAAGQERGGFGLGLAIVDRLGRLLDHDIELDSRPGHGSRFSVSVPRVARRHAAEETPVPALVADPARGRLVVVVDDDALALEGMSGILGSWGCDLVAAASTETALTRVRAQGRRPDLIIADYRLAHGTTGIQAVERLRAELGASIPAFLISGDTAPERLRDAHRHGIHLLHKPVPPMRLRAMLNRLLKSSPAAEASAPPAR